MVITFNMEEEKKSLGKGPGFKDILLCCVVHLTLKKSITTTIALIFTPVGECVRVCKRRLAETGWIHTQTNAE